MEKIKVLLVDDEKEFVEALKERLEIRELSSGIAYDGEQALRIVEDEIPDVMVLDLKMPGIDGLEVLRRARKAYPEVQVIILTGHGSEKHEEEARRCGAFEYLQKPVDVDELVRMLRLAYKKKMEDTMVAATYAEAGDFQTAKDIMEEDRKKKSE